MLWTILGTLGIVVAVVALGVAVDRRFPLLPRPRVRRRLEAPAPAPGTTPATAVPAGARHDRLGPPRCCGAGMAAAGEEPIVYDGRALLIVRLRCPRCGATRSLYIDPA